ncbi:transglycosylase SLT domain-containing protein [Candidatus Bipolaricaulota bacterium]|nr:transglycosylase SLT domain-containing protein [Candidatus Bipolaricaulota bacterium]
MRKLKPKSIMKRGDYKGLLLILLLSASVLFLSYPYLPSGPITHSAEYTNVSNELVGAVEAMKEENYSAALEVLSDYPEDKPLSSYVRYLQAKALVGLKDYSGALKVLEGIEAGGGRGPTEFEKYFLKTRILFSLERYEGARTSAQMSHQFVDTSTDKRKLLDLQLSLALQRERFSAALEKAIELMEATELRFVRRDRDRLFDMMEDEIIPELDFDNQQDLEYLYRYIETLVNYREYRRARSLLLRNMGKWTDFLKQKAYFRLAWLDGFKLDFPEEASWTFNRLLRLDLTASYEARARYYQALFKDAVEEDYDLVGSLVGVNRSFPATYFGKLAAARAFREEIEDANLIQMDEKLERYRNYLSRAAVRDATWQLFYRSFSERKFRVALTYLQALESYYEELSPRIRFWREKVRRAQSDAGQENYLKVVAFQRDDPIDYYSLLAGAKGWPRGNFSVSDTWSQKELELDQKEKQVIQDDLSVSNRRILEYAIQLRRHGLYLPALARLEKVKEDLSDEDYLFLKFQWKKLAGQYRESLKAATELVGWYYRNNQRPPVTVIEAAFPRYYSEEVRKAAGKFGLPAELIYAIIRQESAFDREAYSTAKAGGLMQVIPSTARSIAEDLNIEDFRIEDLFNPEINIPMGSYYIAKQISRWSDPRLGLAAYHGGPGNLRKWENEFGFADIDLFVEKIPLGSTRNYVKAVYRNYRMYRELNKTSTADGG